MRGGTALLPDHSSAGADALVLTLILDIFEGSGPAAAPVSAVGEAPELRSLDTQVSRPNACETIPVEDLMRCRNPWGGVSVCGFIACPR